MARFFLRRTARKTWSYFETFATAEEVSATTEELAAQSEELAATAIQMKSLADALAASASRFRLA